MVGDLLSGFLVMILGFAYPGYECFKTVEKNKVNIDDLRFWCQYWIIMAAMSIWEIFADIFISWLPLYGEMRLAFIVYLWHPRTRGTTHIYQSIVRPFLAKHESDIDRHLLDLKLRAWDMILQYWQNCAQMGQGAFFQMLQYMLLQSQKFKSGNFGASSPKSRSDKDRRHHSHREPSSPTPPPLPAEYLPSSPVLRRFPSHLSSPRNGDTPPSSPSRFGKKWPPESSSAPQSNLNRSVAPPPQTKTVQLKPEEAFTQRVEEVAVENCSLKEIQQ